MEIKVLSSLSKVFSDEICGDYEIEKLSCLKNERVSFQIAVKTEKDEKIAVSTDNEEVKIYSVKFVPVGLTAPEENRDDFFIRGAKSGLYPDVLIPANEISVKAGEWTSVWFELTAKEPAEVTISLNDEKVKINIDVADVQMPEQTLICTHWFHSDCLSSYYEVETWGDEHWRIIGNFMKTAVEHGINFILTPMFTPPLDTEVGGERPTVQLVDVERKDGKYSFEFSKLKKWIELAFSCGMKYIEFSHLFTQWGAKNAPKIMAQTENGYERIFGWETDAHGSEYTDFLRQFAPAIIAFVDEMGIRDKVMFHTSDEPGEKDIESYRLASKIMQELFGEFKLVDALSEYEYYKEGLVKLPVPAIESIEKFSGKVPELWTYYCCNPYWDNMPNRFMAMPSLRSRILGFILYKYGVKGFLHWGYNFYFKQYSKGKINPYEVTDAGGAFSSGDSFVVYPAEDGTAYASLRLKVFYEAIQDYEVLKMLENKIGREKVMAILNDGLEKELDSKNYPHCEKWLIEKRAEINGFFRD